MNRKQSYALLKENERERRRRMSDLGARLGSAKDRRRNGGLGGVGDKAVRRLAGGECEGELNQRWSGGFKEDACVVAEVQNGRLEEGGVLRTRRSCRVKSHKKRRGLGGSTGGGSTSAFGDAAELECRLRGSRAECEQLRMKMVSTQEESSRLQTQVMELHELKDVCSRLETELSLLRSRTQSRTDEMNERLQQMDEENKDLRLQVGSLENQLLDAASPHSLGTRVAALERENDLLCRESADVREEYRRFVEDIGNQVVQSVIVQKQSLRDECLHMRNRLHNLERQNQYLAELLHARLSATPPAAPVLCQECPLTTQHPLAPSLERTACFSERDAPPAGPPGAPPPPGASLSWSPPSLEPKDESEMLAFAAGSLAAVTNGCYYKLEFSQSAISSPMGLPTPLSELPPLPTPPPPPKPVLGRSHVIMGSKTLPLRHSVPSASSHLLARRPPTSAVRKSVSSTPCPPTSRSFSKDDGYASMTCDLTSPIASRRELSTVGECPSQFEEDSTATASDATTATIVAATTAATVESTVASTIGGEVFELDDVGGDVTPTGGRLAPSLDLETCALLHHAAGAAKRLAELSHVTIRESALSSERGANRKRRPASDSALLLLLSASYEADDVIIINSSGSSTGTGSSSSGNSAHRHRTLPCGGTGQKADGSLGPVAVLRRRLRMSVQHKHGVLLRTASDVSLNLSAIDGLECRSSFGSSRTSRALQFEAGMSNSGKAPGEPSMHECLGMLTEALPQALPLKSEQPPPPSSASTAASTSQPPLQPPPKATPPPPSVSSPPPPPSSMSSSTSSAPPTSPPPSSTSSKRPSSAQVPPPVVIQRRRFGRSKSDTASPSASSSTTSASASSRRVRRQTESLSSSEESDTSTAPTAAASASVAASNRRHHGSGGAQRGLSRRQASASSSSASSVAAQGRRSGQSSVSSSAPPPPPRSSSSSSSSSLAAAASTSRSPRVNLVHQTSLDEVKKRQGSPRVRQNSASSATPPTASPANSSNGSGSSNNNNGARKSSSKGSRERSTKTASGATPRRIKTSPHSQPHPHSAKPSPPPAPQPHPQRRAIAEEEEEELNPVVDLLSPSDFLLDPGAITAAAAAGGALAEASKFHQEFLRLCQKSSEEAEERHIREKIGQLSQTVSELQRHLLQLAPPPPSPNAPAAVAAAPAAAANSSAAAAGGTAAAAPRSRSRSSSVSCEGAAASDRDDLYIDDDLSAQPAITLGSENRDSLLLELEEYQLPESSVQQD